MAQKTNTLKLNLGCGKDIRKGYINIDCIKGSKRIKVIDLNEFPYPFEDDSIDEVLAIDIIEHLENAKKVIEELWKICKPNAKIYIRTAHYTSHCAWQSLTHVRPFGLYSFNYYNIDDEYKGKSLNNTPLNSPVKFKIKSKFLFNSYYKYTGLEYLFNRFPKFYEKLLCFIFPCGLLEFKLKVIKC